MSVLRRVFGRERARSSRVPAWTPGGAPDRVAGLLQSVRERGPTWGKKEKLGLCRGRRGPCARLELEAMSAGGKPGEQPPAATPT